MKNVSNHTKKAIAMAKRSGYLLLREYLKFDRKKLKLKAKHEIVTKADLISEKEILKSIKKDFPSHGILSEEAGANKNKSDYLWLVDPLDGTTNFTIHNPLWAVSIGLLYKNKMILGVVYAPFLKELFVAELGKGAYLNGKKIRVSSKVSDKIINTFCHGSRIKDIKKSLRFATYQKLHGLDCRQLGSASIELGYVACGRTESIMIPGAHPWDVAAGTVLVREAGGRVTDFNNEEWQMESEDILASNGKVHKEILASINK